MAHIKKGSYVRRRAQLKKDVGSGLLLFLGNHEVGMNYADNTYRFRQDSSFLYFFGQHREGLAGIIDADTGAEWLIGDDIDIEDIIWTGFVPSVHDLAEEAGVGQSAPMSDLRRLIDGARAKGQTVHYLPPYRHDTKIQIMDMDVGIAVSIRYFLVINLR